MSGDAYSVSNGTGGREHSFTDDASLSLFMSTTF